MRLIYSDSREEVKVGDMVKIDRGDHIQTVRVAHFREPHKPDSSGKIIVTGEDGGDREYYVGVIGAEWVEREDRGHVAEVPKMRNGKPLKTVPDGSPRRMADGKNAWRKMTPEQRADFARWIVEGEDAPHLDFEAATILRKANAIKVRGAA